MADIHLNIEEFAVQHPAMNPELLGEAARVAFAKYHSSPATCRIEYNRDEFRAIVAFHSPHPYSENTLEREDFVEKGAIVMAGTLLYHFAGKQITRVAARGSRIDYFVGEEPGDFRWILEVSGTDEGHLETVRRSKHEQMKASPYRRAPHLKEGFVAVTRFAPDVASLLDPV